jgi:catechol 2,3-dioxygenase-like lactoylglutathione lyase family enzyme
MGKTARREETAHRGKLSHSSSLPDLTYGAETTTLRTMRALGINHVSIAAKDLEESTRFYEEVLGMERIPTPVFAQRVQWLRVGSLQLHLFLDSAPPPPRHHLGFTVDDFAAAYQAVKGRPADTFGWNLVELPSRQVQLYFHDPAGNLIELNWPDADTLDRSAYPDLKRLADHIPQPPESLNAVLYLDGVPA